MDNNLHKNVFFSTSSQFYFDKKLILSQFDPQFVIQFYVPYHFLFVGFDSDSAVQHF